MNRFLSIINIELIRFKRDIFTYVVILFFTLYLATGGYYFLYNSPMQAGQLLKSSSYINIGASLVGLIWGLRVARSELKSKFNLVLNSMPGNSIKDFAKITAWAIVATIITIFVYVEYLTLLKVYNSEFLMFKGEVFSYILIFWGLVLFINFIFGYAIETLLSNKFISFFVLLLIWLLTTPLNKLLLGCFNNTNVVNALNLGENNINVVYTEYFGLNVGVLYQKNIIFMFFMSLSLLVLSIIKHRRILTPQVKRIYYIALVFTLIVTLFCINSYSIDVRKSSEISKALTLPNHKVPLTNFNESLVQIKEYVIKVEHVSNVISYNCSTKLITLRDLSNISFTLYSGYKVKSIKLNGIDINYKRIADYVYLPSIFKKGENVIDMQIECTSNEFCTIKENSLFLPATFPWYPILGVKKLEDCYYDFFWKPMPRNIINKKKFHINLFIKDDNIVTNLSYKSAGEYEGYCNGISLMKGMLVKKKVDEYYIVCPPDRSKIIVNTIPFIKEKIDYISKILNVEAKQIPKKIYSSPLYTYLERDRFIYSQDHLFISSEFNLPSNIVTIDNVFRAFYKDSFNNNLNDKNCYIFECILKLIENRQEDVLPIAIYSDSDDSKELITLLEKVQDLYRLNKIYPHTLLRKIWLIKEKGLEITYDSWYENIEGIRRSHQNE